MRRTWVYPFIFTIIWSIARYFHSEHSVPIAIFLSTVILWIFQVYPLHVTALLIPAQILLFQILTPLETARAFANPILLLFIGCFLMTRSMQKHGWSEIIAKTLMSQNWASSSSNRILLVMGAICWTFSMWISNTATCAMMVPIALGIIISIQTQFPDATEHQKFSEKLLLICAFASSIGGICTPVGSPPNLLAIQLLKNHNISIGFTDWMKIGTPLAIIMFFFMFAILQIFIPQKSFKLQRKEKISILNSMINMSVQQKQIALVFSTVVILWIMSGFYPKLDVSFIGFAGGILLLLLPISKKPKIIMNLHWKDLGEVDWKTIILFAGGLCLGSMLDKTGLAQNLSQQTFSLFQTNLPLLILMVITLAVLLSEFSSNTAAASILIPIMIAFSQSSDHAPQLLTTAVFCIALGTSYGFMLPVSTPPNAIVFGTKKVPLKSMIKTGSILDLTGIIIIWIWALLAI